VTTHDPSIVVLKLNILFIVYFSQFQHFEFRQILILILINICGFFYCHSNICCCFLFSYNEIQYQNNNTIIIANSSNLMSQNQTTAVNSWESRMP